MPVMYEMDIKLAGDIDLRKEGWIIDVDGVELMCTPANLASAQAGDKESEPSSNCLLT